MIRSILMGVVAGMRSMTPLAVVTWAARRQQPANRPTPLSLLSSPAVSNVTLALAAAELLGGKMRSAPDRIITPGILARVATGAIARLAVAPSRNRALGAVLGASVAVGAAYVTLALRKRAIRSRGQTSSGLIEDAVALGAAVWVAHAGERKDRL